MNTIFFDFEKSGVERSKLVDLAGSIGSYRERLEKIVVEGDMAAPEASLCLPTDTVIQSLVQDLVSRYKNTNLKHVIVVGIGGSNLGTQAIYHGLGGNSTRGVQGDDVKLHFLDTFDEFHFREIVRLLDEDAHDAEDFVINVISKSGSTSETVANFELLYQELTGIFGDIRKRVVVTTDKDSPLWKRAQEAGFVKLPIPRHVGGRFSVFSAVGLFPLGLAGVPTHELLEGARSMRDICVSDMETNPAVVTASALYYSYNRGVVAHNNFYFNPRMETIGKWYRQLLGESIGKVTRTEKGESVGLIPLVSVGSTDLHSVGQLYFSGQKNIFTTIVTTHEEESDARIAQPQAQVLGGLVEDLDGKSLPELMDAVSRGVQKTYEKHELPHITIAFEDLNVFSIGEYMQYNMMTIIYLAQLFDVNAFDQPAVEEYKRATRKILKEKK